MEIYCFVTMVNIKKAFSILFSLLSSWVLEIAFCIDRKGRRIKPDWMIHWEGHPNAFAFYHPFILAFDSSFVEIRHVDTVSLKNIKATLCTEQKYNLGKFSTSHTRK